MSLPAAWVCVLAWAMRRVLVLLLVRRAWQILLSFAVLLLLLLVLSLVLM